MGTQRLHPAAAYQTHCAQCHGTNLHGNGPVAEWIYPIPKNLRNSDFLRQLTKERAIQSITHGVPGTPMAPWGEVAKDKSTNDTTPVFSSDEIGQIVDWIFSGIPGGEVVKGSSDVPKWSYSAEDVVKDLHREGNYEKFNPEGLSIFDLTTPPVPGVEKEGVYIDKKFYTAQTC